MVWYSKTLLPSPFLQSSRGLENIPAIPHIEDEDPEQLHRIVASTRLVLSTESLNSLPVEDALALDIVQRQVFIEVAIERVAHPEGQRWTETLLGRVQVLGWDQVAERLAQDRFAGAMA